MAINNTILTLFSVSVLFFCFGTLCQLVLFLSSHSTLKYQQFHYIENSHLLDSVPYRLLLNSCLLLLFFLQHSFQNRKFIKEYLCNIGLGTLERILYNCGSCLVLQILMWKWQSIDSWTIWEIATADNFLWWIFTVTQSVAWLVIYSGCFIMDITELLGVKQVYHNIQGWPEPLQLKSDGLQRFYSHMRHPCFSTLTVILLVHPVMQIDRLLLSCALLIYMMYFLKVDEIDYAYQRRMLQRKERDLHFE